MESKTIFASMKDKNYDYQAQGIRFVTVFDELVNTETEQLDGYMILACNGGKMDLDVNGTRTHLNIWEALILPPRTRLSNYMVSPDLRCDLAIIESATVRQLLGNHIEEWERAIYVNKTNHIRTDEETRKQFFPYIELLAFKLQQTERRYNQEIVRSILRSILFDYLDLMITNTPETNHTAAEDQKAILFRRFIEHLSTHHVKHQSVDTYAQELCVSPNYLTKVCKEMSAKTAMMWIREYTEQDVRYYLLNSDRSVKEICDDLGFPDLSFFAKFCRRAFGCSPTIFRKKMKTESV